MVSSNRDDRRGNAVQVAPRTAANAPAGLDPPCLRQPGDTPSATLSYGLRDRAAPQRIKRFIEQNLASSELSPGLICRHVGVSRSQLYRLFAGSAGVAHYIRSCRLLRARAELLSSTAGVASVAHSCGFSSHAHFSRVFKQHFGLTPWQWALRGRARRAAKI
jgi:AraC-like DNA-binding protein